MLYVGIRKGSFDPNYISTSRLFNSEYHRRPLDFTRQIISNCSWEEAIVLETKILKSLDAARDSSFYNRSNGNKKFVCDGHTLETRAKMSATWKDKASFNCDHKKAIEAWKGSKHTDAAKAKMSESRDKYRTVYSERMKKNNPMSNPESLAKMLETRRKNKELKHGTAG
jgi:hypothetical protein